MSRTTARLAAAAAILTLASAAPPAARAEVILGPAPTGTIPSYYWRFSGGYPDNPAATTNNPTFYQPSLDLSGVGWKLPGTGGAGSGTAWNVTMIDNIHFIGAWHVHDLNGNVQMSIGDTVNFRPSNSTTAIVQRTIANLQQVPNPDNTSSDVMLGTLSAPFTAADHIAAYPIPVSPVMATYAQMPLFVYGRESAVGRNNFSPTTIAPPPDVGTGPTTSFLYDYDQPQPGANPDGFPSTVGPDESHLEGGDSGGPTFILSGGQLQLIGGHLAIASYADANLPTPPGVTDTTAFSVDSFLPFYSAEIAALIAVPEPSSLALVAVTVGGVATGCWRRWRRAAAATMP